MMWSYVLISFGGMIIQVVQSIDASMYGAYFSLFLYAILFRYANSPGAVVGMICSFLFTLWLGIGSLLYGKSHVENLPTTTANCSAAEIMNFTVLTSPVNQLNKTSCGEERSFLDKMYSLSYLWFSTICIAVYLFVSLLVSACAKPDYEVVDPALMLRPCRPGRFQMKKCHCLPLDSISDGEDSNKKTSGDEEENLVTKF